MDGIGIGNHHAEWDKPSSKGMLCSFMELRLKMVMIMRPECIWGTLWGRSVAGRRERNGWILRGEYDRSMLHIYLWREYNEIHWTLFKRVEGERGRTET
jgi:hypothetical protein